MSLTNKGSFYIKVPQSSLYFDASSSVDIENIDAVKYKSFSVAFWFKPAGSDNRWILGNGAQFRVQAQVDGDINFWMRDSDGNTDEIDTDNIVNNDWQHIVCSYISGSGEARAKIYRNGVLAKSDTVALGYLNAGSNNFTIGETYKGGKQFFSGNICEVIIWSGIALDNDSVKKTYNGISTDTDNIVAHWKFDDREGNILSDSINGYDGTINGADWDEREVRCWNSRWDESNWDVVIETFIDASDRNFIFRNVTPGATRELYNILGTPKYIDTTYTSSNTIIFEPISGYGVSSLRQKRTIAIKNISDTFVNKNTFRIKIEGVRIDV